MVLWLNGPFGGGKTTTANRIVGRSSLRLFDPEHVGYLLGGHFTDMEFDDFQDLAPWRSLVPKVMGDIQAFVDADLLAVQSVLVEQYWRELQSGFQTAGLDVVHVVLSCDEDVLEQRIVGDEVESAAKDWRLDHIATFNSALEWLEPAAELVIDTTHLTPDEVASLVLATTRSHAASFRFQ